MYAVNDRSSAIKAVQRLLSISQSGIYDKKTEDSIKKHQGENGLDITGIVDYKTFLSIKKHHTVKASEEVSYVGIDRSRFPIKLGDSGNDIAIVNSLLASGLSAYTSENILPRGNYFNSYSLDAVIRLREIFNLPLKDEIDVEFLQRLKRETLMN